MDTPLPVAEADVVIVGTGAFGLTAAYQLASLGAGRVVALVPTLYTDSLGASGSGAETYVDLIRANTTTIVPALRAE